MYDIAKQDFPLEFKATIEVIVLAKPLEVPAT